MLPNNPFIHSGFMLTNSIISSAIDAPVELFLRDLLQTQCRALEFSYVFPSSGLKLMIQVQVDKMCRIGAKSLLSRM
jgi:hypothetical protein